MQINFSTTNFIKNSLICIILLTGFLTNCGSGHFHQPSLGGGNDENCETLQSEIHLIKEEYDELGRLQRTCNSDVSVNKCEGFCSSQVQPSVITQTGFLKECYCCRESFLKDRIITLNHCYDPDGSRLMSPETATMDVRLKEPAECKCYKCGDFSR